MIEYIYSWLYTDTIQNLNVSNITNVPNVSNTQHIIQSARNMPNIDKQIIQSLNKGQLENILAVKLKKSNINPKQIKYEPRHPVLKELLEKVHKC
jgi:hypothetical protein